MQETIENINSSKRFTDLFIKRPVLSICISLVVLLVGIISFFKMDVRLFPKIDSPSIVVSIAYPGATSEIMEGFITTPVEEVLSSVDGLDTISSTSTTGSSSIRLTMKLNMNADLAMTDIANKVASVRGKMPSGVVEPYIYKHDDTALPLVLFNVSSEKMDPRELNDYLLRVVQPQIQTVSGVGEAKIIAGKDYAMRIWLDPRLMLAHNVSGVDIYNAIQNYNVISSPGTIKTDLQEISLASSTDLQTAEDFNNIPLINHNGRVVHIKDVGKAELGVGNDDFSLSINGRPSTFMFVTQKSDANPLTVARDVLKLMSEKIIPHLPGDLQISTFFDSTKFISSSIHEVVKTVIESCVFVFLVVFFMLGSFRAVFIPLVTIPLSIAGAFAIMLFLGFSINILTLLAFVLAIGLVVDDAIVVLENIHRHTEEGLKC